MAKNRSFMNPTRTEILQQLEAHRDALRRFHVRKLGLFGSFARGDHHADSDIDFIVEFGRKSFDGYMDLRAYLEELFGRRVDLVLPETIKPRLRDSILSETVYAQGL
jgi:uncharacterized protein